MSVFLLPAGNLFCMVDCSRKKNNFFFYHEDFFLFTCLIKVLFGVSSKNAYLNPDLVQLFTL